MAKLTAKKRNALSKSEFAGPDRSYPVPDKSHARNAKARASEMEAKGKLSASGKAKIDAKANKVLGKRATRPVTASKGGKAGNPTPKGKKSRDEAPSKSKYTRMLKADKVDGIEKSATDKKADAALAKKIAKKDR